MIPDDMSWLGSIASSLGVGGVAFYFCLQWVKQIMKENKDIAILKETEIRHVTEERAKDLREWNEYLKGERERDRENLRLLVTAIQDLTKFANSSIKPAS